MAAETERLKQEFKQVKHQLGNHGANSSNIGSGADPGREPQELVIPTIESRR